MINPLLVVMTAAALCAPLSNPRLGQVTDSRPGAPETLYGPDGQPLVDESLSEPLGRQATTPTAPPQETTVLGTASWFSQGLRSTGARLSSELEQPAPPAVRQSDAAQKKSENSSGSPMPLWAYLCVNGFLLSALGLLALWQLKLQEALDEKEAQK